MKIEDQNELQPISDVLLEWRFRNNKDKIVKQAIASRDELINKQRKTINRLFTISIIQSLLYISHYIYRMLC